MSYQPPQPPSGGGYDPDQAARGEGGYDPNPTTPMGDYNQPPAGGYQQPPQQGGYGAPQQGGYDPQQGGYQQPQGGYGAPQQGGYNPQQGGYGAPPPGGPGYYGAPVQPAGTSWAAIVGLITGILSIITCCLWCLSIPLGVAAIALYFVAQGQLRAGKGGKGLATAGLITGIIGILLGIALVVIGQVAPGTGAFQDIFATLTAVANP